jgi:hypothetical protein
MADGAIAPIPIEDDAPPAFWVARLSGQWFRDSAIDYAIRYKLVITMGCTAQGEGYQHCYQ